MKTPAKGSSQTRASTPAPNAEFVQLVLDDIRAGREFVPLIGSGFSAGSGILMGQDFTNYLTHAAYKVLKGKWDLRNHGWPPHPNSEEVHDASKWVYAEFVRSCEELDLVPIDGKEKLKIRGVKRKQSQQADKGRNAVEVQQDDPEDKLLPNFVSGLMHPLIPQILKDGNAEESEAATIRLLQSMRLEPLDVIPIARPRLSQSSEKYITEAGIRSLHDWRTTLEFLARVAIERTDEGSKLRFVESAQSVIDGFNRFITSNRRPNLGHKMLVHLAEPMRERIILTTNFDNLLETAFETFSTKIRVIPVSVKGELPAYQTVRAQNCIIKMHGSLLETRADMSLADEPSDDDKNRFAEYLNLRRQSGSVPLQHRPLLVIGFSGSDPRIMSMIKHALDMSPPGRKLVYWISVSEYSNRNAKKLFDSYEDKVHFVVAPRPDLLLYELYQKACLCLPQGGLAFEFNHYVPPLRTPEYSCPDLLSRINEPTLQDSMQAVDNMALHDLDHKKRLKRDLLARDVGKELTKFLLNQDPFLGSRWHWLGRLPGGEPSKEGPIWFEITAGAVRTLRVPFEQFVATPGNSALWFELQDYVDVESLLRDIVRTIALRRGRMQLQHVMLYPLEEPIAADSGWKEQRQRLESRLKEQFQAFSFAPKSCLIVLYARDAAGTCAGWTDSAWKPEEFSKLRNLMASLCALDFRVIYVPLTKARLDRKSKQYRDWLVPTEFKESPEWNAYSRDVESEGYRLHRADSCEKPSTFEEPDLAVGDIAVAKDMINGVMERFVGSQPTMRDSTKIEFLYALTLFRQSRHPNAMMHEAVYACPYRFNDKGVDNDFLRNSEVTKWLDVLREERTLFDKPGGYLWMHRDMRLGLRRRLERLKLNNGRLLFQRRARIHFLIGDWYFKAHLSSGHVKPVIESIYHRLQAARFARWARPRNKKIYTSELRQHRRLLFFDALNDVLKLLVLARPNLKVWLASSIGNPLFGVESGGLRQSLREWSRIGGREQFAEMREQLCREFEDLGRSVQAESGAKTERRLTTLPLTASCAAESISLPDRSIEREAKMFHFNKEWAKCFEQVGALEIFKIISQPPLEKKALESKLATTKARWIADHNDDHERRLLVKFLSEYAYAILRRAKLVFHSSDRQSINFELWRQMCIACNLGVDYCKHLVRAPGEEQRLRTKLHSIYGLALANLGRFYEAHRHLNEAQAAGSTIAAPMSNVERAIVCLRRAEVFLTECFWIDGFTNVEEKSARKTTLKREAMILRARKASRARAGARWKSSQQRWVFFDPTNVTREFIEAHRGLGLMPVSACDWLAEANDVAATKLPEGAFPPIYMATLDDAWAELDRAEDFLAGESQSSLWWGRLATLRLRIYGLLPKNPEQALRSLVFRSQHGFSPIYDWFERGIRATRFDAFRAIRLIDYANDSVLTFNKIFHDYNDLKRLELLTLCKQYLENWQTSVDGLAKKYWTKVSRRIESSIAKANS